MQRRKTSGIMCVALITIFFGTMVSAGDFPTKKITIINPWSSGGTSYLMATILSTALQDNLGQKVDVLNKPGGGGGVGMLTAKNAKPDGHTMIFTSLGPCGLTPNRSNVGYNTPEDFSAVAQVTSMPYAIAVNPKSGITSFEQLLEMARKSPGELTYGTPGAGLMQHMMFSDFLEKNNVDMRHVPYNGGSEALSALLGNHISCSVLVSSGFLPHYEAETVKVLAVTGEKRLAVYPDVPTLKELGHQTIVQGTWFGFVVTKKVDKDKIEILEAAVKNALETPEVIDAFKKSNIEIDYKDSATLDKVIKQEYTDFAKLMQKQ